MKSHIQQPSPGVDELEKLFMERLKQASLNGFMLGAHTSMQFAVERYGERIRAAQTFEELQPVTLELLEYLENKASGLKKVADK